MWIKDAVNSKSAVSGVFALTLLAVSPFLNGCSPAPTPPQPQVSNAVVEERIKTNLNADAQLKASNLDVKANMDRNEVMLSGTVESEAVKARAIETAKTAHAGLNVTTKIEIDQNCCGAGGMPGRKGGMEGMPGRKGMSGKEHKPQ